MYELFPIGGYGLSTYPRAKLCIKWHFAKAYSHFEREVNHGLPPIEITTTFQHKGVHIIACASLIYPLRHMDIH